MKTYELNVMDREGKNGGVLTVRAKTPEIATGIAVKKGYRVLNVEEQLLPESAVNADAEYNRMRRAVFVGTVQAHLVLAVIMFLLVLFITLLSDS